MITLDLVKLQCRIDQDEEDSLINDWIADAEQVIQNDLDRRIIADESDREDETDLLDNDWLNSARLIYVQYRYRRSLDGKPQAYWDLLQKFRIMGV